MNFARIRSGFNSPEDNRGKIPLLFQVLSPYGNEPLLPEAMYLHVNPTSLNVSYNKIIERIQTRGGWQEQHFGDQLSTIGGDITSGAFINVVSGLAVARRRDTIAYEKFQHIKDIFHNNGLVYDTNGNVQYRGRIQLMFEGGIYEGSFRNLSFNESASSPFLFSGSFSFTVEKERISLHI